MPTSPTASGPASNCVTNNPPDTAAVIAPILAISSAQNNTMFYARQLSPPRIPRIPGGSAVAAGKPLINHRIADLSHEHQEQ